MKHSKRLDRFGEEVFSSLNEKRLQLEAQGRTVYNLSVGTPDFKPSQHVIDALVNSASDPTEWKYSLHDVPEMIDAVCSYYERRFSVQITPDMVTSCHGTQEGMPHLFQALFDEGDTVLVPDPCYPVFRTGALISGASVEYYPLEAKNDFLPCVDDIDPKVADLAKAIVVSLPANPVGSVGTDACYDELIAFAREHDLLIIHDNAYSDIVFDDQRGGSFFNHEGAFEVGVEFLSLSKSFNMTGSRVSFLIGNPEIVGYMRKLRSQIDFGMFYPIQRAAIAALTGPLEGVEEQRLRYQERRDALCDGLEAIGWERPNAHGTMFVWARLPHGRMDSFDFTLELMERSGVVVCPGASFGPRGEGYVRFALVLPPDQLRMAVKAIEESGI